MLVSRARGGRAGDQEHPRRAGVRAGARVDRGAALAELERTAFDGPVLVLSFNPPSIAAAKALAPDVADRVPHDRSASTRARRSRTRRRAGHDVVLPGTRALDPGRGGVRRRGARRRRLRVGTWTVDDPATVRDAARRGASTPSRRTTPRWRSPCSPRSEAERDASGASGCPSASRPPTRAFDGSSQPLERGEGRPHRVRARDTAPGPPARRDAARSSRRGCTRRDAGMAAWRVPDARARVGRVLGRGDPRVRSRWPSACAWRPRSPRGSRR